MQGGDERGRRLAAQSSESVLRTYVDPRDDMRQERSRASFSSSELAEFVNGGRAVLDKR